MVLMMSKYSHGYCFFDFIDIVVVIVVAFVITVIAKKLNIDMHCQGMTQSIHFLHLHAIFSHQIC